MTDFKFKIRFTNLNAIFTNSLKLTPILDFKIFFLYTRSIKKCLTTSVNSNPRFLVSQKLKSRILFSFYLNINVNFSFSFKFKFCQTCTVLCQIMLTSIEIRVLILRISTNQKKIKIFEINFELWFLGFFNFSNKNRFTFVSNRETTQINIFKLPIVNPS